MKHGSIIETSRLRLRAWTEADIDAFHRLSADDEIMRFFPYRRTRDESVAVMARIAELSATDGYGWCAAECLTTGSVVGITGYARVDPQSGLPGSDEIGWRFVPEVWGKGLATEAASALLRQAFTELQLPEMVAFAVYDNHASTAVMRRIGMEADPAASFEHPRVPDTHPHLKPHVTWRVARSHWLNAMAGTA